MTLSAATITYDLSDYGLADFDSRRTKVWATNNVNGPVIDTEGNTIHLGSANGTVNADGTGSITVPTPGTGSNPASWQTTIHVDYPDRNADRGRGHKSFGPFTITVSANLADLVTQAEVPPETLGGDAWLAAVDADDSSQYRAQQDARLAATYGRGLSVTDPRFGAVGDGVANDRAAIQAALDALNAAGGGTLHFPRPSNFYAVDGTLTLYDNITWEGAGAAVSTTIVREVGPAPLFAPTGLLLTLVFRGLSLQTAGGHIFDLGATGAMAMCSFTDCSFVTYAAAASVFKGDGSGDFIGMRFNNCDFTRFSDSTVPGFDIRNTAGGFNGNSWEKCRVTSNGAATTTYFRVRADAVGTYSDQNTFKDIIGQLNPGGLIEFDSPFTLELENVLDYDVPGAYARSLVKIGKAAGGYPGPIRVSNVGNRGGTMNGTTVFQLEISAATVLSPIIDRVHDSLGNRYVSTIAGYGATTIDASGASSILTTSTGSKTIDKTAEGTVVFNGASLTATLPDPTTIYSGRVFVVKNIHSTALTVASAGTSKTIDGSASKSLAQWAVGRYVSDGTQWLTV